MESLLIHGKAPIIEDALTAALGDLLEDLKDSDLVAAILSKVRRIDATGHLLPEAVFAPGAWRTYRVDLWPHLPGAGEPDAVLRLYGPNGPVAAIAVEAKYGAAKSGTDSDQIPELRDQLGRYAQGLYDYAPFAETKLVLYLTASSWPPTDELRDSWKAIREKTELDPAAALGWMSWQDIDDVMRTWLTRPPLSGSARSRIERLRKLFNRAGLRAFEGWAVPMTPRRLDAGPPLSQPWLALWGRSGRWEGEAAPLSLGHHPPKGRRSPIGGWIAS